MTRRLSDRDTLIEMSGAGVQVMATARIIHFSTSVASVACPRCHPVRVTISRVCTVHCTAVQARDDITMIVQSALRH